jgi:adenylate kinase
MNKILNSLSSVIESAPPFIFLGGVHGVGKTTLCNSLFAPEGYHCVTASSLIKSFRDNTDKDKRVDDISDNQVVLLKQLELEKGAHHKLLLDGHFCLINNLDQIEPIDVEVFKAICPSILILIQSNPVDIAERLSKRDGKEWRAAFIEKFQKAEESHAQLVAQAMSIPIQIIIN